MLQKFFTTQMSSGGKELQERFIKMRSSSGRRAKIMSMLMVCAITLCASFATVVMAAVGPDGLEHWTQNELIYRDGVGFSVNVSGQNVPAWITNEVAGDDGNVNITITRYETRDMKGQVNDDQLIEMSGAKGKVGLACCAWSSLHENHPYAYYESINPDILNYKYCTEMNFGAFTSPGWSFENKPIASLIKNDRAGKFVEVHFGIDENKKIRAVYLMFRKGDQNDNATDEIFSTLKSESLSYDGGFETSYINDCTSEADHNYYFMSYEDNYINTPCDGISFEIKDASAQNGIVIRSDVTRAEAAHIGYDVYNKNGRDVSYDSITNGSGIYTTLTPWQWRNYTMNFADTSDSLLSTEEDSDELVEAVNLDEYVTLNGEPTLVTTVDEPKNHFVSGERYKVCAVVFDKDYTVLYRWQQYVTMK